MTKRVILFDLDGTLGGHGLGNGQYLHDIWSTTLRERFPELDLGDAATFLNTYRRLNNHAWGAWVKKELLLDPPQIKPYIFAELLKTYGVDDRAAAALAPELQQGMVAAYPDHWQPIPGVRDVLDWAKEQGYQLAVISNGQAHVQTDKLRTHGLLDAFDHLFFSAELGFSKPDERYFRHVLQTVGCAPSEALVIGDSYTHDIEPSDRLGIERIWIYEDAPFVGLPDERSTAKVTEIPAFLGQRV